MSDDELQRLLAESFDRRAGASVPERMVPPPPRFAEPIDVPRRRAVRLAGPLAAAAAVVAIVLGAVALRSGAPSAEHTVAGPTASQAAPSTVGGAYTRVHVELALGSGQQVGVGMPVVAYFSAAFTDARDLAAATTVSIDGKPVTEGAWYFQRSSRPGYPIEGHYRLPMYWPANSKIHVALPVRGITAGEGYGFADGLDLNFATGPEQVVTVSDQSHELSVVRDGKPAGRFPVSLGAPNTPTARGIKVIMAKGGSICMSGPGYHSCGIRYTQRLTYNGEYLHAAPWNEGNIARGVDTSNGCTNLTTAAAAKLFGTLRVGDVVSYPDAAGPRMTLADGLGDWNISWAQWQTGGLIPTR